jgi:hypothetical protein
MKDFFKNLWEDCVYALSWKYGSLWIWIKRNTVWHDQKIVRGYSDPDIWGLNECLTRFILPRLIAFRDQNFHGVPLGVESEEEWKEVLDKIILAFDLMRKDDECEWDYDGDDENFYELLKQDGERVTEGLELFAKYYRDLWD